MRLASPRRAGSTRSTPASWQWRPTSPSCVQNGLGRLI